jgi:large subunit ribosomal protein L30
MKDATGAGDRTAKRPAGGASAASKPRARAKAGAASSAAPKKGTLRIRQTRSGICTPRDQKATLRGLGFRRLGQEVVRPDEPAIRGMIRKVRHLVEWEDASEN